MKTKYMILLLILVLFDEMIFAQKLGSWITTEPLNKRKSYHAGVQLTNGNILITGGYTPNDPSAGNESYLFDVMNYKWIPFLPMNRVRDTHILIKLNDGSIIAVGGFKENTCEILNKEYTGWTFTDTLKKKRFEGQNVTLLKNGNLLLTGGYSARPLSPSGEYLKECEIYDVTMGRWEQTADLNVGRYNHTSTLLNDGRIIVCGGENLSNDINSCEIFDPLTKKWSFAAPMQYPRTKHTATLLSNGKLLIVGGRQEMCELYDPAKDSWESVGKVKLIPGINKAVVLSNEKYLLLINGLRHGWELYSLERNESMYYEIFTRNIWDQLVLKINDNSLIVAGGEEAILYDMDLFITPTNLCQIYNIDATNISEPAQHNSLPGVFDISCYPNPFNNSTNLFIKLNSSGYVSLTVYNILGNEIDVIYKGELDQGTYKFIYAMNNISSGIYFVRMLSSKGVKTIKIIQQK
jgi:hypothetical protein